MDLIFLILGAVFGWVIYSRFKNSSNDENSNLTETQKKWRAQNNSLQSPEINKSFEMNEYILRNKRQFKVLEWLLTPVDARLKSSYIASIGTLFLIAFLGWLFFDIPVQSVLIFVLVLFIDFITYNKQLLYEVTIWNPEFQEKFMN